MRAYFLNSPRFEDVSEGSETQKLRLMGPLTVYSEVLYDTVTVPQGFVFEESIPTVLFSISRPRGESKRAAAVHDYLYQNKGYVTLTGEFVSVERKQADAVYYELLRLKGVSLGRSWFRWLGVRLGGWSSWRK